MRRVHVVAFLSAGVISGVVASASTSMGGRNVIAFDCLKPEVTQNSITKALIYPVATIDKGYSANSQVRLYCPYPDIGSDRKGQLQDIWFSATDSSTTGEVRVMATSVTWDNQYLFFSPWVSGTPSTYIPPVGGNAKNWTGDTQNHMRLSTTDLNVPFLQGGRVDDYGYIAVDLCPGCKFRGYNSYP